MQQFRATTTLQLVAALWIVASSPGGALGVCCPVPCDGCWIESQGQLNLIVVDRSAGRIDLVPNIRIGGVAPDFALIVPTPSVPEFDLAPATLWQELAQLTRPVAAESGSRAMGCGNTISGVTRDTRVELSDDDVGVIVEETVGAFDVTVVESNDPAALVDWLVTNGFPLESSDAALFQPYVERHWVFTAMKLDPERAPMPFSGWNTNVDPVRMSYAATEFELAVPLMSVNRASRMPVSVFVVDDHRMHLGGFETLYANHITAREYAAISATHPGMKQFLAPHRWLTRLDRTFVANDPMDRSLHLGRARRDQEFRRTSPARSGLPLEVLVLVSGVVALVLRARRRRRLPG